MNCDSEILFAVFRLVMAAFWFAESLWRCF
jgi:hypothetical protein